MRVLVLVMELLQYIMYYCLGGQELYDYNNAFDQENYCPMIMVSEQC